MSTPQELINKYKNDICFKCTQEGECSIRIVRTNDMVTAKCTDFKQLNKCMQRQCNICDDYLKCFGSGNHE